MRQALTPTLIIVLSPLTPPSFSQLPSGSQAHGGKQGSFLSQGRPRDFQRILNPGDHHAWGGIGRAAPGSLRDEAPEKKGGRHSLTHFGKLPTKPLVP